MAAIVNARDVLLQAASPRVVPVKIPIDQIEGLPGALKSLRITASATTFIGTTGATNPTTITLTVEKLGGLTGVTSWAVIAGGATLSTSGDTCTVTGSTVSGNRVTIRARVTDGGTNYDDQIVLSKLGSLSGQEAVNLATQITGQLANGNVSGLRALALLDSVSLSNPVQVVGDLAASRIGVGVLAAGVIYAGTVNVENLVGTTIVGKNLSGADFIYLGGNSPASSPLWMAKVGTDEANLTMKGRLEVGRTDGLSSFAISNVNNLSHGSISTGVTATFRGSSFSVYSETISYPTFQTSGAGGVVLQHNSIQMKDAAGNTLVSVATARTTIRSAYINLSQLSSDPGSINGDFGIIGTELVVKIAGVPYKITKTPI